MCFGWLIFCSRTGWCFGWVSSQVERYASAEARGTVRQLVFWLTRRGSGAVMGMLEALVAQLDRAQPSEG